MRRSWVWGVLTTLFASSAALGQEVAPHASVSVGYSDNPFQINSGARAATVLQGLVGLNILHDGPILYVDADASALREQFLSGGVPNQTVPNGDANIVGNFVPGLFAWTIQDTLGTVSNDPFNALAASRENANVFSTGPDLLLPIAERNHFSLRARYGVDTFSGTNIGDKRYEGQGSLIHDLTSLSQVSVVYAYRQIQYDEDQLYPSSKVQSDFLRYTVEGSRTTIVGEAGWEMLSFGSTRSRTPHALLSLERHLTAHVSLEAEYTHTYSDASSAFVSGSLNGFTAGADQIVQAIASPFKTDTGYVMLSRTAGRTLVSLQVSGSRDDYDSSSLFNRKTYGSDLAADYRLTPLTTVDVRVGWLRENYPNSGIRTSWYQGSISLVRQLSESFTVSLQLMRAQGAGTENNFKENRALLTLSYDPVAARRKRLFDPMAPFRYYEQPAFQRFAPAATAVTPQAKP